MVGRSPSASAAAVFIRPREWMSPTRSRGAVDMRASIIVPSARPRHDVRVTMESLSAASSGRDDVEILLVDNNAQEDTAAELRDYCASLAGRVRYVREPRPGATAARHRGVDESQGDILIFVDDDVEASSGWLKAIRQGFENPEVGVIGGPSLPRFTGPVPAWFWDFLTPTPLGGWSCTWLSLLDIGHGVIAIDPNWIWSLNLSIRRSTFERAGGFHPGLVPASLQRWQGDEETGLAIRLRSDGVRTDYVEEAQVFHRCGAERLTPEYFARRAFYQGVCDSFGRIRYGPTPVPGSTLHTHQPLSRKCRAMAERLLRKVTRPRSRWGREASAVWDMAEKAHVAGWHFHQTEVASDPRLLAWVRRPDFRDADIRREMT